MNKNEECDIVKDLSSLYIERMLSESSQKFIENHLKGCVECNRYYNALNSTFFTENKKEKKNDEVEINHLKKVNKKIRTLKWILSVIIVFILLMMLLFYAKICYIDNINNMVIDKILDMQENSNNYKLVCTTTNINRETNQTNIIETVHYYKDGKHKEVSNLLSSGKVEEETIMFIEDNSYEKTTVFQSLKQIDHQKQDFIQEKKGGTLNKIISEVMLNDAGIHRLGLKTRVEMFDGKKCFVVYDSYNGSYRENYIDKETGNLVRVVSGTENYYTEELYELTENVVSNEDVDISILESEKYIDYKINDIIYEIDPLTRKLLYE